MNLQFINKNVKMSIGRFCGLLQSDGHISFGLDADKTIHPYFIITHTYKERPFLESIQRWLMEPEQGCIPSAIEGQNRKEGALNLKIERQKK